VRPCDISRNVNLSPLFRFATTKAETLPVGDSMTLFLKIIRAPETAMTVGFAILRGTWYILRYSLFKGNIRIGFPFKVYAPVTLKGPGKITIGKGCSVYMNVFDGLTIVTLTPQARVSIGRGCGLAGLTIRCAGRIEMGNECLTAASIIQDSMTVNSAPDGPGARAESMKPKPISIGDNSWLGGQCCVLRGSRIGKYCVVAAGALTHECEIADYRLITGSPSGAAIPIEQLLKFGGNP
jgi:acetyltransferase-like isoleucine patch superfamily enzyme